MYDEWNAHFSYYRCDSFLVSKPTANAGYSEADKRLDALEMRFAELLNEFHETKETKRAFEQTPAAVAEVAPQEENPATAAPQGFSVVI